MSSIVTIPDKRLREPAKKVGYFGIELENQINKMIKMLRSEGGIGLAANQIGYNNQVLVVEFNDPEKKESIPLQVFVNPEIKKFSEEKEIRDEGCLSVPKIELPTERSLKIKICAQNEKGKKIRLSPTGLLSRILQHESDHLNGIVYTQRVKEKLFKDFPDLKKLKILFCGSGDFARLILEGLTLLGLNISIVTEKGKPAGRKQEIKQTVVAELAQKFGKDLIETDNISTETSKMKPCDILICADFGQILPQNILNLAKIIAINIHPSLLPKYRGPSPIQSAILNGEKETGVSIIKMVPKVDAGPILAQAKNEILDFDDALTLEMRLSVLGLKVLFALLPKFLEKKLTGKKQDEKETTLTRKFTKIDGEIDWQKKPEEIERQIRAFYPWPGSYTFIDNKRLIVHKAHLEKSSDLISKFLKLVIDIVQPEGCKPMTWKDFLYGHHGSKPNWFKKI